MKVRRSIALLLAAMLLVCVSETLAASAWVLWVRDERLAEPKGGQWGSQTNRWNLLEASSDEAGCRRVLQERIERVTHPDSLRDDEDVMSKVTENTVEFVFFPKGDKPTDTIKRAQILHYVCLPDTVDPRQHGERK